MVLQVEAAVGVQRDQEAEGAAEVVGELLHQVGEGGLHLVGVGVEELQPWVQLVPVPIPTHQAGLECWSLAVMVL